MARYHPRKRRSRSTLVSLTLLGGTVTMYWWMFLREDPAAGQGAIVMPGAQPRLTTARPEGAPLAPRSIVPERGENPRETRGLREPNKRAEDLLKAGRQAIAKEDWVTAREYLSEALDRGVAEAELHELRANLILIAEKTIFSARIFEDDPLAQRYVIKAGDTLGKIAKRYKISDDFIATINGIRNKNLIRVGQAIKVVHGPFHAVIDKAAFTMDIYLGDASNRTFVKRYDVGLGEDGSTPTGQWKVKNKIFNPPYYPPRGGIIIAADDPENPLGEHWLGLEGVAGGAVGQERYGIHGTIEPESIKRNASMGCIRMYNEDVAVVSGYLVVQHSTVIIK